MDGGYRPADFPRQLTTARCEIIEGTRRTLNVRVDEGAQVADPHRARDVGDEEWKLRPHSGREGAQYLQLCFQPHARLGMPGCTDAPLFA